METSTHSWADVARPPNSHSPLVGTTKLAPDANLIEQVTITSCLTPKPPIAEYPALGSAKNSQTAKKVVLSKPTSSAGGSSNEANMKTQINSLNATIETLNVDLARRSSDLIQVKANLANKEQDIADLQETVATLSEQLAFATVSKTADLAKDTEIDRLKKEIVGLRNSLHTGVISLAQLYGPDSVQTFEFITSKEGGQVQEGTINSVKESQIEGGTSATTFQMNVTPEQVIQSREAGPSVGKDISLTSKKDYSGKGTSTKSTSAKSSVPTKTGTPNKSIKDNQVMGKKHPTVNLLPTTNTPSPVQATAGVPPVSGEWTTIPPKTKPKKKAKNKGKAKAMPKENENTRLPKDSANAIKTTDTRPSVPGKEQKSQPKKTKRSKGTVIGSATPFSQKPDQPGDLAGEKKEPPVATPKSAPVSENSGHQAKPASPVRHQLGGAVNNPFNWVFGRPSIVES